MIARKLGKNGPVINAIGYGCMGMSEFYGKALTKDEAAEIIHKAFNQFHVNFFDTADMYGSGLSEELLGAAVAPFRDKVIIATKCGIVRTDSGMEINSTADYIKKSCDNSLKRLNTKYIDVYFLHRRSHKTPMRESMHAMLDLIKAGKIRYVGLSEVNAEDLIEAHDILGDKLVAVQTEYSLLNRKVAEEILPTCRKLGVSFVAYSPIVRGLLSGKYRDPSIFGNATSYDCRKDLPQFQQDNLTKNLKVVEAFEEIAKKHNCTPAQLSLAWLLAQGDDIIPIPGTTKLDHLKENMGAIAMKKLTKEELAGLDKVCNQNPTAGLRLPEPVLQMQELKY